MNEKFEIFDSKSIMSRPIQLIDGNPYFAANITIKGDDKKLKNIWVISSGDYKDKFSELGIEGHTSFDDALFVIELSGTPRPGSTLSADAYRSHVLQGNPLPALGDTFKSLTASIDKFVAFDAAFAPQEDMSEFLACWVLSTYATPVFDTVGSLYQPKTATADLMVMPPSWLLRI